MTTSTRTTADTQPYLDAIKTLGVLPGSVWEARISPRRQRMALQVKRDGCIVLALPAGAQVAAVTAFVASHSRWLTNAVARQHARPAAAPAAAGKRLVNGEIFELLGRPYQLQVGSGTAVRTSTPTTGPALLHLPAHLAGDARGLIEWYCATGMDWIRANAPEWERRLSLATPPAYMVRDLGTTRLGVYNARPHLVTLHWPVFQLAPDLVEGALVHEQVHATRPGGTPHGAQFRAAFDSVLPGNRRLERQIRVASRAVWRGMVLQ